MPIPVGITTSVLVRNIQERIKNYNQNLDFYVRDYQQYISKRRSIFCETHKISDIFQNDEYISELRWILDKFGMNARRSQLTEQSSFSKVIEESTPIFEKILEHETTLQKVSFTNSNQSRDYYSLICEIYNLFSKPGKLSYSGGFVIASKTMHFILPDLFVMIDGAHIGISLYNISDYHPHSDNGKDWFEAIPSYSGKKSNPSPRGQGRTSWDSERYCIALLFYKRIYHEWIETFNSNHETFIELDTFSRSVPRIIDKSLW